MLFTGIGADGLHDRKGLGDGRGEEVQQQARLDSEDHDQGPEWNERQDLHGADVGEVVTERCEEGGDLPEDHPLVHEQEVGGGQDHHERRHGRGTREGLVGADQDEELADEPGQPGQAGRGEDEEPEDRRVDGGPRRQAAHLGDRPVVGPLVDHADQQEQGARDEAVVDHLEDRALEALLGEDEDAEGHEAHVADRRIGDQPFEVGLDERHDRAVDDRDEGQHDDDRRERLGGRREQGHGEPDEPVGAELEQDRGKDHGARRRRLRVRVGEPGVEREHRDLDREGQEEREEGADLERVGEAAGRRVGAQRLEVEGAGPRAAVPGLVRIRRGEDGHEHQQRPDERVQDELDRGVDPVGAAPDPDDQVHRDEHDLPEDVEQEGVEGEEHADHPDLEDEERDHVFLDPDLDRPEAREQGDPRQGRGQDDQRHRQAVGAQLVLDAEVGDPGHVLDELEAGAAREVADEHRQRGDPCEQGEGERDGSREAGRQDRHHEGPDQRQERDDRQDRHGR